MSRKQELLAELAALNAQEQGANPALDNPAHLPLAQAVANRFKAENNRRHNDPNNKLPVIKGDHTPLSWCIQGNTIVVVLKSGPKLFATLPTSLAEKTKAAILAAAKAMSASADVLDEGAAALENIADPKKK